MNKTWMLAMVLALPMGITAQSDFELAEFYYNEGSYEQAAPREGASDSGSDSDELDPERFERGPSAPEAAPASSPGYAPSEGNQTPQEGNGENA